MRRHTEDMRRPLPFYSNSRRRGRSRHRHATLTPPISLSHGRRATADRRAGAPNCARAADATAANVGSVVARRRREPALHRDAVTNLRCTATSSLARSSTRSDRRRCCFATSRVARGASPPGHPTPTNTIAHSPTRRAIPLSPRQSPPAESSECQSDRSREISLLHKRGEPASRARARSGTRPGLRRPNGRFRPD